MDIWDEMNLKLFIEIKLVVGLPNAASCMAAPAVLQRSFRYETTKLVQKTPLSLANIFEFVLRASNLVALQCCFAKGSAK